MKKIKILYVLTVLDKGGLETMLMNYFRNMEKSQFEFHFLVHRNQGHYEQELLEGGAHIHRVSSLSFSIKNFIKYKKELDDFFKKNLFDIVHVHNNSFGYYPLKYAKKYGNKVRIIHSHISALSDSKKKVLLGKYLNKKIPLVATELFACGLEAGKWMFGKRKFEVIHNAIDVDKFIYNLEIRNEKRKELYSEKSINLVNVGRFNMQKNHIFLLEIFAEVIKINPNYKLFLVGDGELNQQIFSKIKDLKLEDKVQLLGLRDDIPELLQAMDVFLFPSLFEGLPVSLVEAQATGIKCVISDGVPTESILIPENVTVIPLKNSAQQWAEKIAEINNFERKNVATLIKEKGYDIKENAQKLEKKYKELINQYKKNPNVLSS